MALARDSDGAETLAMDPGELSDSVTALLTADGLVAEPHGQDPPNLLASAWATLALDAAEMPAVRAPDTAVALRLHGDHTAVGPVWDAFGLASVTGTEPGADVREAVEGGIRPLLQPNGVIADPELAEHGDHASVVLSTWAGVHALAAVSATGGLESTAGAAARWLAECDGNEFVLHHAQAILDALDPAGSREHAEQFASCTLATRYPEVVVAPSEDIGLLTDLGLAWAASVHPELASAQEFRASLAAVLGGGSAVSTDPWYAYHLMTLAVATGDEVDDYREVLAALAESADADGLFTDTSVPSGSLQATTFAAQALVWSGADPSQVLPADMIVGLAETDQAEGWSDADWAIWVQLLSLGGIEIPSQHREAVQAAVTRCVGEVVTPASVRAAGACRAAAQVLGIERHQGQLSWQQWADQPAAALIEAVLAVEQSPDVVTFRSSVTTMLADVAHAPTSVLAAVPLAAEISGTSLSAEQLRVVVEELRRRASNEPASGMYAEMRGDTPSTYATSRVARLNRWIADDRRP